MPASPSVIDFVIIGGFLGAGKTTLIARLSDLLQQRGKCVGIVTNDQASDLVDTRLASLTELPVAEVAGGCFCCRFDDLIQQAESVGVQGVDVILTEPVGSCTDLVATVYEPLRRHYPNRWRLAPFTVVVDPRRAAEYLSQSRSGSPDGRRTDHDARSGPGSDDMAFLFCKQLEEAELIVLNKVDTLTPTEREDLVNLLRARFQASAVLEVSAKTGEGLEDLLGALGRHVGDLSHRILTIDYQRYAAAEAALGWLNATMRFEPIRSLSVTVNARVALLPDELESAVCDTAQKLADQREIQCFIDDLACFQPAEPRPTHRVPAPRS